MQTKIIPLSPIKKNQGIEMNELITPESTETVSITVTTHVDDLPPPIDISCFNRSNNKK